MAKKYELVNEKDGLFQIKALIDIPTINVSIGDLGGWIEKESNLSHDNNAWVAGKARVSGEAWVSDNAIVSDNARVYGNAIVFGEAWVDGNAVVDGNVRVSGKAIVAGKAIVFENARVDGNAIVFGNARVSDNARVYGNARVSGNAIVAGNAIVSATNDILVVGPIGSRNEYTTFMKDKDNNILVACGCFFGDLNSFKEKVTETHKDNKHGKAYLTAASLANIQLDNKVVV